jgi:hypothetical protein
MLKHSVYMCAILVFLLAACTPAAAPTAAPVQATQAQTGPDTAAYVLPEGP